MTHWLKEAFYAGLRAVDTSDLLKGIADHVSQEGEWIPGVVSPSLCANPCRLARLKIFLGDDSQPGQKFVAVRAGRSDHITQLNFTRGFVGEGLVVTALRGVLDENRILGCAPTLLFGWDYRGDDWRLQSWNSKGMAFRGHPDLMVWSPSGDIDLVQIKFPSLAKIQRIERMGEQEALSSYRAQMMTEMYIGRKMGFPISRNHLMVVSWDAVVGMNGPHCEIFSLPWDESMASVPEQIALEIVDDYDYAYTQGLWPAPMPAQDWDKFPCSYCRYPRLASFELIGCEEQQEWERYQQTGLTRITDTSQPDPDIIDMGQRTRRRRRTT